MTAQTSTAPKTRRLSAGTLTLAGIGAASLAARIILEVLRRSDQCRTATVLTLEWLIWIALLSSALALVVGVIALARRSQPIARTVVRMGLALVVGILLFAPGFAFIVCGDPAA